MKARAIVPHKALAAAKSRLGGALSADARAALSLALLRHVCGAVCAAPGVEAVLVMTPDAAVGALAAAWGVRTRLDPRAGLNAALAEAVRETDGPGPVLIVAADLPLLRPADVEELVAAAGGGRLALAPSKEGTGTNAVGVPPGMRFAPAYGAGSLAAHRRAARRLGREVMEIHRPGLAFDVDTEADLLALDGYWATFTSRDPRFGWR